MSKNGNSTVSIDFRLPVFEETFSAVWVPVYLEPITHSGERITIGLIFRAIDGSIKVINTLPLEVMIKVFGNKGKELHSLSNFVMNSFDAHMKATRKFETFIPSVKGVYVGTPIETIDNDLAAIIFQVRKNFSLFSALFVDNDDYATRIESHAKIWCSQIQSSVVNVRSTLINNFNRPIEFRKGAKKATIGYVGNEVAFNFGALNPDSTSFLQQQNRIIRGATELNSLNKLGLANFHLLEVNVWTPDKKQLTKKTQDKLISVQEEIECLGDDIGVRIYMGQNCKRVTEAILNDAMH